MSKTDRTLHLRRFAFLGVAILALLFIPARATATSYAYRSPLTFTWTPASGTVDLYHVYLSVDGGPFERIAQVTNPSCQVPVEDGRRYTVMVQAENTQGTGPPSDPSEAILVLLNGPPDEPGGPSDPPPEAPSNGRPVADAGPDQILDPTRVTLDGSGSHDPDGDPLTFFWTQTAGPPVVLSDAGAPQPWFLGITAGLYRFRLVVNDGRLDSFAAEVNVTIRNVAPTADAGPDRVVYTGSAVTLDGGGSSDPNNDPLTYTWTQEEGPPVVLQTGGTQACWFVPEASGVYRFALVVSDGSLESSPDEVLVIVHRSNHVPTADAGPDQTVMENTPVTLDGSGSSDPDGDPLAYQWTQREGPAAISLQDAQTARPSFTPDTVGVYVFRLVVHDGNVASPPDDVTVTVEGLHNRAPVAVVNEFVTAAVGDWVELNGQGSYDPDNDPLTYAWVQVKGPRVTLEGTNEAVAGFYLLLEKELRFQLVVDDGELYSPPAVVEVTVELGDHPNPLTASVPRVKSSSGCSSVHRDEQDQHTTVTDGLFVLLLVLPPLATMAAQKRRARKHHRSFEPPG